MGTQLTNLIYFHSLKHTEDAEKNVQKKSFAKGLKNLSTAILLSYKTIRKCDARILSNVNQSLCQSIKTRSKSSRYKSNKEKLSMLLSKALILITVIKTKSQYSAFLLFTILLILNAFKLMIQTFLIQILLHKIKMLKQKIINVIQISLQPKQ